MSNDKKPKEREQNLSIMRKLLKYIQIKLLLAFFLGLITWAGFTYLEDYECKQKYLHLNSNVACGSEVVISKGLYNTTEDKLSDYIKQKQTSGEISRAAVFFRDLSNGPTFGINEEGNFTPASLLKLPLSFVVFNLIEQQPELLNAKILFEGNVSVPEQEFQSTKKLDLNHAYSFEELIAYMLKHSDNDAYMLLRMFLDENGFTETIKQTYLELGFLEPQDVFSQIMNAREYSSFFRLLYNASYLNFENSEKILKWLSESDFNFGLRANIPSDIKIAHKFGQRNLESGNKYLHDCGIIYYPSNPYLLCVMTEGEKYDDLIEVIQYVSNEIYKEVDSRRL